MKKYSKSFVTKFKDNIRVYYNIINILKDHFLIMMYLLPRGVLGFYKKVNHFHSIQTWVHGLVH